ncbi:MAG: glycosyltransferase family 4 protein [Verrucomicrobia bacterium]|nr:glycosyltransferase family 4 protein [Verrucomicrobiota bacterium]
MKALLVHPGTQHAFRLARELHRLGLLGEFWTSLALREDGLSARLARTRSDMSWLRNRIAHGVSAPRLHSRPLAEWRALLRLRCGADPLTVFHERNAAFQKAIPDLSLQQAQAVIAFDTSGWLLARRAQQFGKPFILDRTIAHPAVLHRLAGSIERQYPSWTVAGANRHAAVAAAEDEEHARARRIVVGSSFARDTLIGEGVDAVKIRVNPYGVDWTRFATANPGSSAPASGRPQRFLFAGSVIARKGIPVLLEAWQSLDRGDAELWIAGGIGPAEQRLIPALPGLRLLGRIPNADMQRIYAETDVLVLPSLVEGFSLVLLEALAAGLPVIATPNTGAGDFLTSPVLGELVETGSAESLRAAMERQLLQPADRTKVRAAAAERSSHYSWEAYGRRWADLFAEVV